MERTRAIAKAQKLKAVAENSGATEAEALAALEAMCRIMEQHDIADADLVDNPEEKPERIGKNKFSFGSGKRTHPAVLAAWRGVELLFNLRVWVDRKTKQVMLFGHESDTIAAKAALSAMVLAAEHDYSAWRQTVTGNRTRRLKYSYMQAFGMRVSAAMKSLAAQRQEAARAHSTGTALVLQTKSERVAAVFQNQGIKLTTGGGNTRLHGDAFQAGARAGDAYGRRGAAIGSGAGARRLTSS